MLSVLSLQLDLPPLNSYFVQHYYRFCEYMTYGITYAVESLA